MFNSINIKKIKELIKEFFQKAALSVEVKIIQEKEEGKNVISINLTTGEPQILIGEKGQTLLEIQHLLKAVLRKKLIPEAFYLNLDINNYKQKKREYLKELARSAADEVNLSKKEKILAPMPAYERRIIHLELADNPNIETESIGQGLERRIVVRPASKD